MMLAVASVIVSASAAASTIQGAIFNPIRKPISTPLPALSAPHWILQHWPPTGAAHTLTAHAAEKATHPASITKLLTAYVTLQAIAKGETTFTNVLIVSEQAATQDGTRVGYLAAERVTVQDALQGMLAISGNDAAWALAQHLGAAITAAESTVNNLEKTHPDDTLNTFASRMNAASKVLGLSHSQWQNPHGLTQDSHVSSAADLAKIAHSLWHDFPQARPWLSVKTYTWNGVTQSNRNSLLWRDATVDGLKTGHTDAAGYNLAATSNWRVFVGEDAYDWRLASVVLGADTKAARTADSAALLAWGRSAFVPWLLYPAGQSLGKVQVGGAVGAHSATAAAAIWQVLAIGQHPSALRYELLPAANVAAPVAAGSVIGLLNIYDGSTLLASTSAITAVAIDPAPWYHRLWGWVKSWFVSVASVASVA